MDFLKRFLRHVWMSPIQRNRMFPQTTLDAIQKVIAAGETTHRGEIRFVVEAELTAGQLWANISSRQRAIDVFSELRVWDTEENIGVLLYVLLADRKVEIVADRGIDRRVGAERWRAICKEIELRYRRGEFLEGTRIGIEKISAELAHAFPAQGENPNELPDKPVVM
ncbi:MAG: TPM domain-containing protein [Betaproteobacteria bacterium]|nr:TPM domain-containing protein [Betaproteobacteria bacterium]